MVLSPGLVIGGDFRVVAPLAKGGMGSVWVVEQLSVGRRRALKVMRSELAEDEKLRERFVLEAKIGATIDSEHVVEVVAAGIDDALDVPWLAMELLEGSDLGAVLAERHQLPPAEVAEIAAQLGHALTAAFAAHVVHRDLKPENVFLARSRRSSGPAFEVKVLDFGLSKVIAESRSTVAAASTALGTPLYIAPEQADAASASETMDVWAVGLMAYRMLTGRYFWRAASDDSPSATALLREVLFDRIPPASERAAEQAVAELLPPGFDAWFARCVDREPTARYPHGGDACASLVGLLQGVPTTEPWIPVTLRVPSRPVPTPTGEPTPTPPSTPTAILRFLDDEDLRVGRVGDIVLIRWWRSPTLLSIARLDAALKRALAGRPRPAVVVPVISSDVASPNAEARGALADTIGSHDRAVGGEAYVVLGSGFQAATLRAVVAGLTLVTRTSHPTRVFATVATAVDWIASRASVEIPVEARPELVEAIERFCTAVIPSTPA